MNSRDTAAGLRRGLSAAFDISNQSARRGLTRATGIFYAVGGALADIAMLLTRPPAGGRSDALYTIATAAAVVGPTSIVWGRNLPRMAYHLLIAVGTALVTAVILLADGGPLSIGFASIYTFVLIIASFFFTWPGFVVQTLAMELAATWSLHAVGVQPSTIVLTQGCGLAGGLVIGWLARMAYAVEEDPLTGLPNARGLDYLLAGLLERTEREHSPLALVIFDLDHFKQINDVHGALHGDRVLTATARAWTRRLTSGQQLCRSGGDRFAALLPDCSLGLAGDIADELRSLMPLGGTASAGVAAWHPGDSVSVLISRADAALYQAKSAGGDMTVAHGDPHRGASELEAAISKGQMVLHYQPVVRLVDRVRVSAEALVRWDHPRKGLVAPGNFVPQAEQTGAIHALGDWTLREACRATALAPDDGSSVAVNVSVHELRQGDYADRVRAVVGETGLAPDRLILEVTEGVFDDHDEQVSETLAQLRGQGFRVAIDDFGSGYSSLRWLERLPSDLLKIDAGFVRAIPDDGHAPMLAAIIGMAAALGKRCVAEGIETEHQAAVLVGLGCELGQGYLFGRPAPVAV